ncbi:hypothetical protein JTY93_13285 [Pseudomonas hygromyciniae]|uniref:Lipocalin-like domain-containing protein n=1 Tax=Pseudomonas hygromyciniae TaxID=2812000 RepID=A0ABX7JSR1_9PSED|nr:hypothetical protein [Pseudomonas hygromyciniae]MBN0979438.1 hypothetical protein [Pseudomonas hygromyciniae]QSB37392.1 hypothetical protein JTY93_13285 [Pseudomonas hygromyciniae]
MPTNARPEIKSSEVKSNGTMEGEVFIDTVYSYPFKANFVHYVNNQSLIQLYGSQGESQDSTIIAVSLRARTPSGFYEFDGPEITDMSYSPPSGEDPWMVTGGGLAVTFNEDGKRASGTLQVLAKRGSKKLDATVKFNISNQ